MIAAKIGVFKGVFQSTVGSSLIFWRYIVVVYRGEKFSGYNKPKRTPKHPKKSHAVLAKKGDKIKLIRFGQQGVRGAGKNPKTKKDKARKKSYYARHNAQDSSPDKLSARSRRLSRNGKSDGRLTLVQTNNEQGTTSNR